jgi:hypothetical protein
LGAAGIELEIQGEQLRNNNLLEVSIIDILDPFKKIDINQWEFHPSIDPYHWCS